MQSTSQKYCNGTHLYKCWWDCWLFTNTPHYPWMSCVHAIFKLAVGEVPHGTHEFPDQSVINKGSAQKINLWNSKSALYNDQWQSITWFSGQSDYQKMAVTIPAWYGSEGPTQWKPRGMNAAEEVTKSPHHVCTLQMKETRSCRCTWKRSRSPWQDPPPTEALYQGLDKDPGVWKTEEEP